MLAHHVHMTLPDSLRMPPPLRRRAADGARLVIVRDSGTSIWTPGGKHVTRMYPDLALAATVALPDGCMLDGELLAADGVFLVSDLLADGHRDLRQLPRAERRRRLTSLAEGWPAPFHLAPQPSRVVATGRPRARSSKAALEPVL